MDTFVKYHLTISRADHKERYQKKILAGHGLHIKEVPARYGSFSLLLQQVGGPWGWTQRPKYHNQESSIIQRLKHRDTRLFLLLKHEHVVGYCLAAQTSEDISTIPGLLSYPDIIEIENFGLFPEHTGKKYGRYFLPEIFERLFETHETVYLSTRSTNHKGVVPFYKDMGMKLLHHEVLPDDLICDKHTDKVLPRKVA